MTRSGSTLPRDNRRSQLESRVDPIVRSGILAGGCEAFDEGAICAGFAGFTRTCGSFLSRDKGVIVAATRAQSAASSGLSERTRGTALRDEQ